MSNPFYATESQITDRMIWSYMNSKSQCSIASVVAINASPVSVNIQPLVNYFDLTSGKFQTYPILNNIPVAQFQTNLSSLNMSLNVGDTGLVIWFDREVYSTLVAGATTPQNPDSGNISDTAACVFIPMITSFSKANPLQNTGSDLVTTNPGNQQKISLVTQITNLCTQLGTLISDIQAITVNPGNFQVILPMTPMFVPSSPPYPVNVTGPTGALPPPGQSSTPVNSADFTTVANAITAIKNNLITFIGTQP